MVKRLKRTLFLLVFFIPVSVWAASVTLTWDYTQGSDLAVVFNVYKQLSCTGGFTLLSAVTVPTQTYTDTQVIAGSTYCWKVTAQDAVGMESAPSNVLMFQVPKILASPSNLHGTIN